MSQIKEQIRELRQYASERKGEIADICNRAADTIEGLSEKLRTSRYSDAEIQKMQDMEQAEIEKAYELGRMEHEPCENEYIKVPKKALKYRTAGMVAYNAEWLKDHFDIERAVICGECEPCDVAISRHAVLDLIIANHTELNGVNVVMYSPLCKDIKQLPPVIPQPKIGKWIHREDMDYLDKNKVVNNHFMCGECGFIHNFKDGHTSQYKYCPNCGKPKMQEVEE